MSEGISIYNPQMDSSEKRTADAATSEEGQEQISGQLDFSTALGTWKDINLGELQKKLDGQGIEIVENQKENTVGRKKLAEQTREFKKISDEEKLTSFRGLLKAYQGEIDNLTKRSKFAENAFLSVYKTLAEAPDPYPLLDTAVEHTAKASEVRQLEIDLKAKQEEYDNLKKQVSASKDGEKEKNKAQERVDKLESQMENLVKERLSQKEAEMNAVYDERLRNYEEREKDLQRQVEIAQDQLRDLRFSNDSTQAKLLDRSQKEDQEVVSRRAEIDYLTANLQRANTRAAEMEQRNEKLRAEIENVRGGSESQEKIKELENQVSELQSEASKLISALDTQKQEAEHEMSQTKKRLDEANSSNNKFTKEIGQLKEKVSLYSDYDDIKRELDIMKYVEFGSLDLDEIDTEEQDDNNALSLPDPNANKENKKPKESLEALVMAKNRKVQDELTGLRVAKDELETSVSKLQSSLESTQIKLNEQIGLNDKLENDLLRINSQLKESRSSSSQGKDSQKDDKDPLRDLNIGSKPSESSTNNETSNNKKGLSPADASILPIITNQRDRFRQRNSELEEQIHKQYDTVSELRTEIKRLQADNLKLYEKVRYTQSYHDAERAAPSTSSGVASSPFSARKKDDDLGKYKNLYEESMDPFEAFKGREHSRAIGLLNPFERILLNLSGVILGSRLMRNFFVVYAVSLHLFVFVFVWSSTIVGGHSDSTSKVSPQSLPQ